METVVSSTLRITDHLDQLLFMSQPNPFIQLNVILLVGSGLLTILVSGSKLLRMVREREALGSPSH